MSKTLAGYKYLKTYKLATVVYDLTVEFCNRWIDKRSRTHDQKVQAARSGKQNIAEGYKEKSLKAYIKLCGVANASLEELKEDFIDFLRQRGLPLWGKDHPKVREFRAFRVVDGPEPPQIPKLPQDPTEAANMMITFINMTQFLLTRQIEALEEKFIEEGGYTENLFRKRLEHRRKTSWRSRV